MKKVEITLSQLAKSYFGILFLCFFFINFGHAQSEMSLWYIPANKPHTHQHGTHSALLIPCNWNYYHRYNGEKHVIEYGIRNEGDAPLMLTLPLNFTDDSAVEFSIMEQPAQAVISPGAEVHFKVQYQPFSIYRPAIGTLNISTDDANSTDCTLQFRVGGIPPPPDLIGDNCFKSAMGDFDINGDNTTDYEATQVQVFDDRKNVIENLETLLALDGRELGTSKLTKTYDANSNVLSCKEVGTGVYAGFFEGTNATYTYDANNNLLTSCDTFFTSIGDNITKISNTYDANNNLKTSVYIAKDETGLVFATINTTNVYDANNRVTTSTSDETSIFGPPSTSIETNTYDVNGNLILKKVNIDGMDLITTTNTYDSNNNLLTSILVDLRFGVSPLSTIINTYNTLNSLLTQMVTSISFGMTLKMTLTNIYDTNNRLINEQQAFLVDGIPDQNITTAFIPCDLPQPSIADPCNCGDPLNKKDRDEVITHFHDVLTVSGTPGDVVILQTGNTNFLDNNLLQIADGTNLGMIPASGEFNYDFFHASGASGSITLNVGGVLSNPFDISVCSAKNCIIIPTMSQWSLLIFSLLLLNISIFNIDKLRRFNIFNE